MMVLELMIQVGVCEIYLNMVFIELTLMKHNCQQLTRWWCPRCPCSCSCTGCWIFCSSTNWCSEAVFRTIGVIDVKRLSLKTQQCRFEVIPPQLFPIQLQYYNREIGDEECKRNSPTFHMGKYNPRLIKVGKHLIQLLKEQVVIGRCSLQIIMKPKFIIKCTAKKTMSADIIILLTFCLH